MTRLPVAGPGRAHPAGTLAIVVASPHDAEHAYRLRFADGSETNLTRGQFRLLRNVQEAGLVEGQAALHERGLERHVIVRCLVGSRAYGLATETSDEDVRGVYLPPAEQHWSLYGVPEQLEDRETDEVYWEMQKFLLLALKANPNILEVLHTPEVLFVTRIGKQLLEARSIFVSQLVFQTYAGYVAAQFRKIARRRASGLAPKWKHAMHLIRLLLVGITALREGRLPVRVDEAHRAALLAVRRGEIRWEEVDAWRLALLDDFERASKDSVLPERPDYEAANELLLRARRAALDGDAWEPVPIGR